MTEPWGLSKLSFDYCFPGDEFGFKLTIFVGRERTTGMSMGTVVPMKGSSGRFVVDKVVELLEECGCSRGGLVIKSDRELAIKILVHDVVEATGESCCRIPL